MPRTQTALQETLANAGTGAWALWRGLSGVPSAFSSREPFGERRLARAMLDYLWGPLPTVLTLSTLVGISAGVLCATILRRYHAELAVLPSVARILAAQAAPLIVGIFAAGRISVALAAKFGAMQIQGEIDGLVLGGREPVRFVLGPIVASILLAAPVLTIGASLAALIATGALLSASAITPFAQYLRLVGTPLVAQGILMGVVRSYVFMLLSVFAGAIAGTADIVNLEGLGKRIMAAFNGGLLLIFTAFACLSLWN